MNKVQALETVKRLDQECAKADRAIHAARRIYESALFGLIQAEREHAAACQKRTAFEGRHMDILEQDREL